MKYTIWFDGGCKPNPGQGYGSWQIRDQDDILVQHRDRKEFGYMTNNLAEYRALQDALAWLVEYINPIDLVLELRSDSVLVVNQINGTWKAHNQNIKEFLIETLRLLEHFHYWEIFWNRREENVIRLGH